MAPPTLSPQARPTPRPPCQQTPPEGTDPGSRRQVARQMGVSQRRVSAIEHGEEQATRTTLAAYVTALGGRLRLVAEFEDESLALG
ncbi:MAG TPA: helix-turn-helix transcriptional regulator [Streptosporangiaceae bacterium]|nr:helix-turn-helix transcriptional regulator [Streptosporangiaceae bacterium]